MDGRNLIQEKQRGQLPGVDAVGLAFALENGADFGRMSHDNPCGEPPELVVQVTVPDRRLIADREALGDLAKFLDDQSRRAHDFLLLDRLSVLVENADTRHTLMNVQTDGPHASLLSENGFGLTPLSDL